MITPVKNYTNFNRIIKIKPQKALRKVTQVNQAAPAGLTQNPLRFSLIWDQFDGEEFFTGLTTGSTTSFFTGCITGSSMSICGSF